VFEGRAVPEVLLSGNHDQIRRWRAEQSLANTRRLRPDLLNRQLSPNNIEENHHE
jgi:tRNA (guanine37-N1)-methyltransferase